jgi:DNA ligase-1
MTLYEIVKSLQNAQGSNAKQAILLKHKDNELFKAYIKAVYDPAINYYQKKIATHTYEGKQHYEFTQDTLDGILYHLAERNIAGRQAERWLGDLYAAQTPESKMLVKCLIDRSVGAAVGDTMVLKTWPDLYFIPGYMRCSLMTPKIKKHFEGLDEIYCQMKADGSFCYLKSDNGKFSAFTRAGSRYPEWLAEYLVSGAPKGSYVFVGELLVSKDNKLLDRATGNGIYNSILKGGEQEDYDGYRFYMEAWDVLPVVDFEVGLCEIEYRQRYTKLKEYTRHTFNIGVIDTQIVNSLEDAYKIYSEYTSEGYEGAVIKDGDSLWRDHTSPYNVKLKIKFECDLKIVGVVEGAGKAKGMMGALNLTTSDDLLLTDCGTGFSDKQRKEFWENREQKLGSIVTVSANDIISNRNNSTKSLFLPAFEEERFDKTEADSYERVVAQLNTAKQGA